MFLFARILSGFSNGREEETQRGFTFLGRALGPTGMSRAYSKVGPPGSGASGLVASGLLGPRHEEGLGV